MAYSPYSDIQKVYNAKVAWNKATTDEERKRQNEIATAARKNLEAYGYSDVVNQISASGADATATRKILEKYAPTTTNTNKNTTAPASTELSNPELITINNNETRNKINQLWGTQKSDREVMANKYNKLENTAYSNPFETDEAKAILAKYDLAAMQGRNNAVASGGASNGGNIDSYAAANALRQQAALTNKGQMVVLDAHNNKINNVKGILESLGVYQQNQDKGMQTTIGLQANEGQRLFENEETAKNNDVARKSEIASVTGYVPNEWTYENNIYLNSDGTVKDEFLTDEFDSTGGFTTIINNAKAKLATTTDATERANLQATINAATQAKALKTFSSPKYSKYAHEVQGVTPTKTEGARVADMNNETVLKTLGIESADKRYEIDATKEINADKNATELAIADKKVSTSDLDYNDIVKMLKQTKTPSQELINAYNALGIDGTQYTTQNPPPMTGTDVEGTSPTVDLGDDANKTPEESKEKDIFTQWEDSGVTFKTFTVQKPSDTDYAAKLESADVDKHGEKAINGVYSAVANGELGINGTVSNYDLADYLISHSDTNDTNKNQLKKVFAYFGLDKNMLEQVEDSGFWFWQWGQGTNYKK